MSAFAGVQLIVTDLDRTLIQSGRHISRRVADALNACREKGIVVAYATARPARAAFSLHPAYRPDYILANNGATLCDGVGNVLEEQPIPSELLGELLPSLCAHPAVTGITLEMGDCLYTSTTDWASWPDVDHWNPKHHTFATLPQGQCPKISVECGDAISLATLLAPYPQLRKYSNAGEHWHQITHKDTSKAEGIRQLAKRMAFPLAEVAAFGDDENDTEMLRISGIGVAVADALPAVRRAAKYICPSAKEDGVAQWIEQNVLHRK